MEVYRYVIIRTDPDGNIMQLNREINEDFYESLPDLDFMIFKSIAAEFAMIIHREKTPKITEEEAMDMLIEMIKKG